MNVRLIRLYDLSDNKLVTVTKMNSIGWGVGCEACICGRRLLAWEEDKVKSAVSCYIIFFLFYVTLYSLTGWCER